ncbi:hypothetical protein CSOJ01_06150 [Colletotrichum sojae]|uniref:Uncharacterized protein n=1 Tax=Colletotrichum sojae TaxID=2175907 RepID=A0A8H6MWG0_9PEZI|nr:hypothetical protein CSOJ01_06150 [Colletotrichum sojae]
MLWGGSQGTDGSSLTGRDTMGKGEKGTTGATGATGMDGDEGLFCMIQDQLSRAELTNSEHGSIRDQAGVLMYTYYIYIRPGHSSANAPPTTTPARVALQSRQREHAGETGRDKGRGYSGNVDWKVEPKQKQKKQKHEPRLRPILTSNDESARRALLGPSRTDGRARRGVDADDAKRKRGYDIRMRAWVLAFVVGEEKEEEVVVVVEIVVAAVMLVVVAAVSD